MRSLKRLPSGLLGDTQPVVAILGKNFGARPEMPTLVIRML